MSGQANPPMPSWKRAIDLPGCVLAFPGFADAVRGATDPVVLALKIILLSVPALCAQVSEASPRRRPPAFALPSPERSAVASGRVTR
jgi:hypothetical protein